MSNGAHSAAYFALAAPILFFLFWCGVLTLVGIFTGWHALAQRFTSNSAPCGEVRTAGPFFYTVYMRYWGHYSSVVRVTAAQDALYLSVFLPFRAGHPPLRIPWSEIQFSRTKRFWQRFVVLTLGMQEQIPFRFSERMAHKLGLLGRFVEESSPRPYPLG